MIAPRRACCAAAALLIGCAPAFAREDNPGAKPATPPTPPKVVFLDRFEGEAATTLEPRWATAAVGGRMPWYVDEARSELRVRPDSASSVETLAARRPFDTTGGLAVSVDLRQLVAEWESPAAGSGAGVALLAPGGASTAFSAAVLRDETGKLVLEAASTRVPLPDDFRSDTPHRLLLVYLPQARKVEVRIDGRLVHTATGVTLPARTQVALVARKSAAAFASVAIAEQERSPLEHGAPPAPAGEGWHLMPGDVLEQRHLGAVPQLYPSVTDATEATEGTASVVVRGWALGRSAASPRYGLRIQTGDGPENYVEALIDPAKRTLTTRAFVGGREALAPQESPLPARFEFTDEHRIRVAWADGGRRWSFSLDKEPTTVQERELPVLQGAPSTPAVVPAVAAVGAAAPAPAAARRRFVPVLVTEDTRAAYYGLSVTGVAASAQQPAEQPADLPTTPPAAAP